MNNYHRMVLELTPLMIQELTPAQVDGCYNTIPGLRKDYYSLPVKRWWLEFIYVESGILAPSQVWIDPNYLYEAGLYAMHYLDSDIIPEPDTAYVLCWDWSENDEDVISVPVLPQQDLIHQYWFVLVFQRNAGLQEYTHIKAIK